MKVFAKLYQSAKRFSATTLPRAAKRIGLPAGAGSALGMLAGVAVAVAFVAAPMVAVLAAAIVGEVLAKTLLVAGVCGVVAYAGLRTTGGLMDGAAEGLGIMPRAVETAAPMVTPDAVEDFRKVQAPAVQPPVPQHKPQPPAPR